MSRVLVVNLGESPVEATATVATECVLDISRFGDVVGVEIISLAHGTGQWAPGSRGIASLNTGERVSWSYDQEADTFYISIKEENPSNSAACPVPLVGQVTNDSWA